MSYIITIKTKKSILMASDTRLNYFNDKIINGEKYQNIIAVADCIRKTFFIDKAKIGIQFLGVGYFPDANNEKYPLSHFINKLCGVKYGKNFKKNVQIIFNLLKEISKEGDTGQYIKGTMSGFGGNGKSYVCTFNTYNNDFEIQEFDVGQFIDSENNNAPFPDVIGEIIEEINKRINQSSKAKSWNIGGPIEILKITPQRTLLIQKNTKLFDGTQKELVDCFNNNISKINGSILSKPHLENYHF